MVVLWWHTGARSSCADTLSSGLDVHAAGVAGVDGVGGAAQGEVALRVAARVEHRVASRVSSACGRRLGQSGVRAVVIVGAMLGTLTPLAAVKLRSV